MTSNNMQIHPSSIIEDGAIIGDDVSIGPFCHIGPKVKLGNGIKIQSHASIIGNTTIGENTVIFPQCALGGAPQNIHYKGENTELIIGNNCTIREGVTMHTGMPDGGGKTTLGDHSLLLAYCHVAHDCHVGSHVILSNNVMLAGHVTIGDNVIMGGGSAVHQFTRIGHRAFIGGLSFATRDVIPYGILVGNPAQLKGLNVVGLKRAGFSKADIHGTREFYNRIFDKAMNIQERIDTMETEDLSDIGKDIIQFIQTTGKRGLSTPKMSKDG